MTTPNSGGSTPAEMLAHLIDELDKWDDYEYEEPEIWAFIKKYAPKKIP